LKTGDTVVMDEGTRKKLDDILTVIQNRKETFGKALIGLAFSKDEQGKLRICFGTIKFLEKGETPPKATTYDYGNFVLTRKSLSLSKTLRFVISIFEEQLLKFNGWAEIPLEIHLAESKFVQSHSRYGHVTSVWPIMYIYGRIDDKTKGKIPHDSLSKLGLPLFPTGVEAINIFFDLSIPRDWYTLESRIELRVPDYRAKIKSLRLSGKRVTVEVETRRIAQKDVLAKFYCRTEDRSYTSIDLPLKNSHASFTIEDEPFQVETHILSAIDEESIDQRKFDYRYPSREEGIVVENIEAQLLDMIDKGENVNVEFKRELGRDEFLETVVAFANTNGGTIFLGIDDSCRIVGLKEDVKTRILDLIAEYCDPPIEVQIDSEVLMEGMPITLVKVQEGPNKPYTLKDRGIFIRRGASDRQVKRTELDEIYETKKEASSSFYA